MIELELERKLHSEQVEIVESVGAEIARIESRAQAHADVTSNSSPARAQAALIHAQTTLSEVERLMEKFLPALQTAEKLLALQDGIKSRVASLEHISFLARVKAEAKAKAKENPDVPQLKGPVLWAPV